MYLESRVSTHMAHWWRLTSKKTDVEAVYSIVPFYFSKFLITCKPNAIHDNAKSDDTGVIVDYEYYVCSY